jgi:protein-S-isoprenylcysteine O-methyltransferase Ste14
VEFDNETRSPYFNIGETLFHLRDYTPIPLIIILFLYASPNLISATIGLTLVFFGELFRIYSVAFIGTVSRTRSSSTGSRLITTGPFAYVRNPLYVGNFLITTGIAIYSGTVWIMILTILAFATQYFFIVEYEESILREKFGAEYDSYCKTVPAWFAKRRPKIEEVEWPSPQGIIESIKSEKRTLTGIFAILMFFLIFYGKNR